MTTFLIEVRDNSFYVYLDKHPEVISKFLGLTLRSMSQSTVFRLQNILQQQCLWQLFFQRNLYGWMKSKNAYSSHFSRNLYLIFIITTGLLRSVSHSGFFYLYYTARHTVQHYVFCLNRNPIRINYHQLHICMNPFCQHNQLLSQLFWLFHHGLNHQFFVCRRSFNDIVLRTYPYNSNSLDW